MNRPVISFRNVSLEYKAYKSNREVFASEMLGMRKGTPKPVLDSVSFDIYKGEKVALIGNTGKERDAVIEIIGELTHHTKGKVMVNGKVAVAMTFSVGFDYAMDMNDNIELKGYMMGWSRAKVKRCKERIMQKAGLLDKKDYKLKDLKPTDVTRLGFYMFAENRDADIYVIDCPLFVGDADDRRKCMEVLKEMTEGPDKTLVIANKYAEYAKQLCNRGIAFEDKRIVYDGKSMEAVKYYQSNYAVIPKVQPKTP